MWNETDMISKTNEALVAIAVPETLCGSRSAQKPSCIRGRGNVLNVWRSWKRSSGSGKKHRDGAAKSASDMVMASRQWTWWAAPTIATTRSSRGV